MPVVANSDPTLNRTNHQSTQNIESRVTVPICIHKQKCSTILGMMMNAGEHGGVHHPPTARAYHRTSTIVLKLPAALALSPRAPTPPLTRFACKRLELPRPPACSKSALLVLLAGGIGGREASLTVGVRCEVAAPLPENQAEHSASSKHASIVALPPSSPPSSGVAEDARVVVVSALASPILGRWELKRAKWKATTNTSSSPP